MRFVSWPYSIFIVKNGRLYVVGNNGKKQAKNSLNQMLCLPKAECSYKKKRGIMDPEPSIQYQRVDEQHHRAPIPKDNAIWLLEIMVGRGI